MGKELPTVWDATPKQAEFLSSEDYEVLYGGAAGGGKMLALDTPIPTPHGWTTMGAIRAGDVVYSEHGAPITVAEAFAVDLTPDSYRLTFDDGSTMEACADHRWLTFNAADLAEPTGAVRTTADIFATLRTSCGGANHAIALAGALQLPVADLPVDPYCLGAWLGDGDSSRGYLTSADPEIPRAFGDHGFEPLQQKAPMHYRLVGLTSALRSLGLLHNKHVPQAYLRASAEQRLALLQGLMDTDGTVTDSGAVEFTNTNRALADAVYELIVSLGWKVRMVEGRATLHGKDCGQKYDLKWTPDQHVFRLPRKRDRQKLSTRRTTRFRYIVDCQRIEPVPMRCIAVENPSGLFLAGRQMVVTHNSDSLLIDLWALQHGGPKHPKHRAIVFRRSFPELKDLIDRARELFPQFISGVKYDKNEHIFTTPAGARYEFGYLNNDNDRFKYRGRAWNKIGFDELTLWATPVCYEYLSTRNRTVARDLPCDMRATTNPDGVGQKWVMERWGIEEDGGPSRMLIEVMQEVQDERGEWIEVPRMIARTFIPAKLSENPHLRGTGYRERLSLLAPDVREALLAGRWAGNQVDGAYYFKDLQKARAEGRIGRIPHRDGIPVNTFWDLGKNDFNSIWFHQSAAFQNCFLHSYQNSGEYLPHYVAYLKQMQQEHGYVYGAHYLPHDAGHKPLVSGGKSVLEQLQELMPGERFVVVPRVERRIDGINQMRAAFASCFFDADQCADGLASLAAYRKKYNNSVGAFTDEHVHDSHSNYADAIRQFAQGYDGARTHITAAEPEWKKRLRLHHAGKRRSPATA